MSNELFQSITVPHWLMTFELLPWFARALILSALTLGLFGIALLACGLWYSRIKLQRRGVALYALALILFALSVIYVDS